MVTGSLLARARTGDPWAECPMTVPQLRALSLIAAAPTGLSSRELASLLGVGASAVTPLVDRLVDHGRQHHGQVGSAPQQVADLQVRETAAVVQGRGTETENALTK